MNPPLLRVDDLEKHFDGIMALRRFSCSVQRGDVLGLIGPNGAGKTTFFNIVTGFLHTNGGTAVFKDVSLTHLPPYRVAREGIARTFQDLRLVRHLTVLNNVLLSFQKQPGEHLHNVFLRPGLCARNEAENRQTALEFLSRAGLADKAQDPAEYLSYGQQKLLSLVCCLATGAELLLLDEPVAGIAPEMVDTILSMVRQLPAEGKTVMLIEHNLDAVMRTCNRVIFMDAGTKVSEGTPDQVRNDPRVIEAYLD